MNIIEALDVKKNFGDFHALRGLNLTVSAGECVGLLGPNGAGKSTFISTVYGVTRRSSGSLKIFGFDPETQARDIKRQIGVVPQENALDEALTVIENMRLFAAFTGVPRSGRDTRILELLNYMALDSKKDSPIRTLSGGMKRRLTFVRALLTDPQLIILDEPTTGLDPAIRHLLWEKVVDLRNRGKTILLTTHYMHEAEILCNRIVILNKGVVVDQGAPQALIDEHTPGFVAIFGDKPGNEELIRQHSSPSWTLYRQSQQRCLRAPQLEDLIEVQRKTGLRALQMRPSNLEDVFIKLTGEDLTPDD